MVPLLILLFFNTSLTFFVIVKVKIEVSITLKGEDEMNYIAHIREDDKKIQTVEEHLQETKSIAEMHGEKIGIKYLAGLAGLLHDLGKYSMDFQHYILEAVNNPDNAPKRGSVDHSTAGGKLLYELFHNNSKNGFLKLVAEIVGNSIISHHSYLKDFLNPNLESDYLKRVEQKEINDFEQIKHLFFNNVMNKDELLVYANKAAKEVELILKSGKIVSPEKKLMFLTKFVFSILIDADRTNTRCFEENINYFEEMNYDSKSLFKSYYEKLMEKINSFDKNSSKINLLRSEMSDLCDSFGEKPSGIYTLSIPTGGGKTLASLRYALKHAIEYKKKRVIYVVPFTTIIEQNAEEVRKILNDDRNILEHHFNVIEDEEEISEDSVNFGDTYISKNQKLKLAKDNWDSPIIFTTMVQFLNVFYAKGNRNIRRLHNLCDAVIIFDEVQKVPTSCISAFNDALNFLNFYGKSSLILCTATQPALDFVDHSLAIKENAEIVNNLDTVIEEFRRVDIVDCASEQVFNNEMLSDFVIELLEDNISILVILNTKKVVKDLYERLKKIRIDASIYHLSTSMCAAHRNDILAEVKEKLKNKERVICVSTQLIEAGVDISFQCVIRSLAGLDSIAQAAGRCNRHGEMERKPVYIIDHIEENLTRLKEIDRGKNISKRIFKDLKRDKTIYGGNVLSRQAMEKYFKEFYAELKNDLNYYIRPLQTYMTNLLISTRNESDYHKAYKAKYGKELPLFIVNSYGTAAEYFEVIKDLTTTVIVPYKEGKEMIATLNSNPSISELDRLLKVAQRYSVGIYDYEKEHLLKNEGLESYFDGKVYVLKEGSYDKEYGLNIENDSQFEFLSF